MKKLLFGILTLAIFLINTTCFATNYYIAKDGDDSNPGTLSQPWNTIEKANSTLLSGDTVYMRGGTYAQQIRPSNNGTPGNYIIYTNYNNETVTITTSDYGANLSSRNYVIVDGIKFNGTKAIQMDGSQYCVIQNITFNNLNSGDDSMVRFRGAQYCKLLNSTLNQGSNRQYCDGVGVSGGSQENRSKYCLIEGNDISYSTHFNIYISKAEKCVVRNNTLHHPDDVNLGWNYTQEDGYNESRMLIENNDLYQEGQTESAGGNNLHASPNRSIIRYNRNYDPGPYATGHLDFYNGGSDDILSNKIYNNVFYKSAGSTALQNTCTHAGDQTKYNKFVNNIVYGQSGYAVWDGIWNDAEDSVPLTGSEYHHNLLSKIATGQDVVWLSDPNSSYYTLAEAESSFSSAFHDNIEGDPEFTDGDGYDFTLQSSSPCINAGGHLTIVHSDDTGTGTTLKVVDAGYFQDSWGIDGVQADWIAVGSVNNVVQISSINYDTNTITLANSISRQDNDPVWLYKDSSGNRVLFGSAPDIGAFEYNSDTNPPSPPTGLTIQCLFR